jgi:hypothetical protein
VLRDVEPDAVVRGESVTLTLGGQNLKDTYRIVFDDPAISGTLTAGANPPKVALKVGPEASVGLHRLYVQTPLGTTGGVTFYVGGWPRVDEKEPNDSPTAASVVALPSTLAGRIQSSGDVDCFRFQVEAGQELVFQTIASPIRSRLQSVLEVVDSAGKVLAEAMGRDGQPDALLSHRFPTAGTYAVRIRDFENAAGGDVYYRLNVGSFAHAERVFPLGFRQGEAEVTVSGANLPEQKLRVTGARGGWGVTTAVRAVGASPLIAPIRLAVGEEPEATEAEPNDGASAPQPVQWPVTVNGRISAEKRADADCFRFSAKKGQTLILEVNARRLGSPLDPVLEVLDAFGKRVERATLRCVAETILTLNDRDSANPGLRMLAWNDFAVNDYVYLRGELARIAALPRGPDDDARFKAIRGQRLGFLETTPTGHANGTPVYKVQIHPPGRQFPPNGMPVFRLHYRNDDGGPLYGKDSRVTFTAPADGEYVARIADVRGEQSDLHAYRLTIREPRPDFRLTIGSEHPNVPAGARVPLDVSIDRIDGFDGEVTVRMEGLPEGFSATSTTIEPGEVNATLLLTAAPGAKTPPEGTRIKLVASAGSLVRTLEPAAGLSLFTVLPKPDLTVETKERRITIVPGAEQHVEASIVRHNGFAGRVPIELQNLPFGVRVLDVGLNGVLITEAETSRRFTIYCEPWVKPQKRLVYCTVRTETNPPVEVGAEPILLEVAPPQTARR